MDLEGLNDVAIGSSLMAERHTLQRSWSALERVIDQYQVTKQNGTRSDPNRADNPEYIGAPRRPGGLGEPRNRAAGGVFAAARGCLTGSSPPRAAQKWRF
jgi:hypothetical protein